MLKAVTINAGKVEDGGVVDAPDSGRPLALEEIADFAKYAAWVYLADVVLSAGKVRARDSALTF